MQILEDESRKMAIFQEKNKNTINSAEVSKIEKKQIKDNFNSEDGNFKKTEVLQNIDIDFPEDSKKD